MHGCGFEPITCTVPPLAPGVYSVDLIGEGERPASARKRASNRGIGQDPSRPALISSLPSLTSRHGVSLAARPARAEARRAKPRAPRRRPRAPSARGARSGRRADPRSPRAARVQGPRILLVLMRAMPSALPAICSPCASATTVVPRRTRPARPLRHHGSLRPTTSSNVRPSASCRRPSLAPRGRMPTRDERTRAGPRWPGPGGHDGNHRVLRLRAAGTQRAMRRPCRGSPRRICRASRSIPCCTGW